MNDPRVNLPSRYALGHVIVSSCGFNPAEGVLIGVEMKFDGVAGGHLGNFETPAERRVRRNV